MDSNSRFGGRRSERRKAQRDPMNFPVSLHSISQSRVALLLDVSLLFFNWRVTMFGLGYG